MSEVLLGLGIVLAQLALWFGVREASVRIGTRSLFRDYPELDRRAVRRRFRRAFDRGAASLFDVWTRPRRG